jgi:hypothetical protein
MKGNNSPSTFVAQTVVIGQWPNYRHPVDVTNSREVSFEETKLVRHFA